jgi:hypothetical protein
MSEPINIAILGESPNDTEALIPLLNQRFGGKANFVSILSKVRGSNMDTVDFPNRLRIEFQFFDPKPQVLVAVRDLDGLANDKKQNEVRKDFFRKIRNAINESSKSERRSTGKGKSDSKFCYLLCIYEIEALIMADIEVFNHHYGTNLQFDNPEKVIQPKEVLTAASSKSNKGAYDEADCRKLFPLLRIDTVEQNSRQFRVFLQELDQAISSLTGEN